MTGPLCAGAAGIQEVRYDEISYDQHCRYRTEHQPYAYRSRYDCERYAGSVRIHNSSGDLLASMFDVTVDEIIAVDTIDVKCG